jgi:small conductance mechanosensitive channel
LGGFTFLGLMGADWISIFISIIIFFIGYVVLTRLFYRLLKRVVQRTKTTFDDEFLQTVGPDIERLVGLFVLRFAIQRLSFMSIPIRGLIDDITYILGLIFVVIICLKLVNFTATWYRKFVQPKEKKADQLDPVIALLQHVSYAFIIMVGFLIGLVHFGVDVSIFTGILLIVGLGVVLGARAIVADLVAGFIILAGRPFRVGDAIQLQEWPEYGFVEEIGTRATQVRTIDNRAVIVRNSVAINDQIVNYSTPDSTVMVKTHVRIAYHADLNQIRKLITDTVQGIEGVLPDKPINILYREFGESARLILVRWWIADFDKEYYIVDDVNSAIEAALNEAGFNIPYSTLDLNLNQIEELRQMMSGPKSRTDDTDS